MTFANILIVFLLICLHCNVNGGILFPRASETRELLSLDGVWHFSLVQNESSVRLGGLSGDPYDKDLHLMPVPSSYNDIPTTIAVREHLGPVLYHRTFIVPKSWRENKRVWLRFGSVCYAAYVYVNNKQAFNHTIGHLPFVGEITSLLVAGENSIHVVVDTTLTDVTIPQGSIETLPGGRKILDYTFDFFNYGGIDRPVFLYTTPTTYIDDITIVTRINGSTGIVSYKVDLGGNETLVDFKVTVLDKKGKIVAASNESSAEVKIENAKFWWPYLMKDNAGYQYTLNVDIIDSANELLDTYSEKFGIRELAWDNTSFTINRKPIYFRGFGRHEDSDIRGKGLDLPLIIRDHNLIRWIGANSYRTSHYPYAEEIMDMADELGIMILDEVPAVNTDIFSDGLLENHKRSLTELYQRDKNRPSVVVWSIANEPLTNKNTSEEYYRQVSAHIKSLDLTRPITIANAQGPDVDHSGQFLDILSYNIYDGWYEYTGELDSIYPEVIRRSKEWFNKHNKPVMVTEYGADTLEGFHSLPAFVWSEEYQVQFMEQYFKAYDELRAEGWFIGEMIWNFADFKTGNSYTRVGGNKKGIFTRQRQPKDSAHLLRARYWTLAEKLDGAVKPSDHFVV